MKNVILIIAFSSSFALACGGSFPTKLECRNPDVVDNGVSLEFLKLSSGKIEMKVYKESFAGPRLLMTEELESKKNRLKNKQFKVKFSKGFKVLKRFQSKGNLNFSNFICL